MRLIVRDRRGPGSRSRILTRRLQREFLTGRFNDSHDGKTFGPQLQQGLVVYPVLHLPPSARLQDALGALLAAPVSCVFVPGQLPVLLCSAAGTIGREQSRSAVFWISLKLGAVTSAAAASRAAGCPFDNCEDMFRDHAAPTAIPVARLSIAQMTMPLPPNRDVFFEAFEDGIEASSPGIVDTWGSVTGPICSSWGMSELASTAGTTS